jgi:Ca2+-binding EF-hand superfamily protein
MQRNTKIALIAVAGLAAVGGAAFAQTGWRHSFQGHGPMRMVEMTERYDANKDGKISQDEIDANRASWIAEFDADKSGALTLTEFQNLWLKARNQQMVREFQSFDRDGNGQVTLDEYKRPLASFVAEMDRDNDKAVSGDELAPPHHWGKRGHGKMGPDEGGPAEDGPDTQ